jgi:uncharacterized phage-associated protein
MNLKSPPDITDFDIANWFLAQARSENKPLKHMKLQKLVYFAYGWYYAYCDEPLFGEEIFALWHGPIVGDLYHKYKHYDNDPITDDVAPQDFTKNVAAILDAVWQAYGQYSDFRLSAITHRDDSPWAYVYDPDERHTVISPESIQNYFKALRRKYNDA